MAMLIKKINLMPFKSEWNTLVFSAFDFKVISFPLWMYYNEFSTAQDYTQDYVFKKKLLYGRIYYFVKFYFHIFLSCILF